MAVTSFLSERFFIPRHLIRATIHYPPAFYQLHVVFSHAHRRSAPPAPLSSLADNNAAAAALVGLPESLASSLFASSGAASSASAASGGPLALALGLSSPGPVPAALLAAAERASAPPPAGAASAVAGRLIGSGAGPVAAAGEGTLDLGSIDSATFLEPGPSAMALPSPYSHLQGHPNARHGQQQQQHAPPQQQQQGASAGAQEELGGARGEDEEALFETGRAHLLADVIGNLESDARYYQTRTLSLLLRLSHPLALPLLRHAALERAEAEAHAQAEAFARTRAPQMQRMQGQVERAEALASRGGGGGGGGRGGEYGGAGACGFEFDATLDVFR